MSRIFINSEIAKNKMQELEPNYDFSKFEYINKITKSTVICDKGHEYKVRYHNFINGSRCPHCFRNSHKNKISLNKEEAISKMKQLEPNYDFSKFSYTRANDKSTVICNNGHEYEVSYGNFVYHGTRCPHCIYRQSKPEKEIVEFIKTFYNGPIEQSNRDIVPSKFNNSYFLELDIYLPDLKFAIEFNGVYWHNNNIIKTKGWKSNKEKHDYKTSECFKKGINLLHIDEDDYDINKQQILNNIKRIINGISKC